MSVPRKLVPTALVNWYRVLKRGGQIIIEVPTLVPLMTKYLNKEVSIESKIIIISDDDSTAPEIFISNFNYSVIGEWYALAFYSMLFFYGFILIMLKDVIVMSSCM